MMGNTAFFGWSWIFGLIVLAGIALLVYVVVRVLISAGGSGSTASTNAAPGAGPLPPASTSASARQILDERFARGELTTEQYREQVRTLGEGR